MSTRKPSVPKNVLRYVVSGDRKRLLRMLAKHCGTPCYEELVQWSKTLLIVREWVDVTQAEEEQYSRNEETGGSTAFRGRPLVSQ